MLENKPSLPKASEILTSNKITIINEYIELVETQLMTEQIQIDDIVMKIDSSSFSNKEDFNDYVDFLNDQNDTLDNIKTLSFQLSIVSLFRIVELGIKN